MVLIAGCRIRFPYPFQWGRPTLNVGNGFAMMAAALVSMIEVRIITVYQSFSLFTDLVLKTALFVYFCMV